MYFTLNYNIQIRDSSNTDTDISAILRVGMGDIHSPSHPIDNPFERAIAALNSVM